MEALPVYHLTLMLSKVSPHWDPGKDLNQLRTTDKIF
jgi:hypothetical protein